MYSQVTANRRRSYALLAAFALFVGLVAWAFSQLIGLGIVGVAIAVVLALGSGVASWWGSDRVALRMSRAVPADPTDHARLNNLVEGLCIASGLPKPRIYVIDDAAPNAFATGRDPRHATIAVTTGLLDRLTRVELEGVLAHELSHIKNDDILLATVAVTCVGLVTILADIGIRFLWWNGGRTGRDDRDGARGPGLILAGLGFALLIFAPVVARLLQFALSRRRETLADVSGIEMTRYPPGLISALEKLRDDTTVVHASSRATAHLWLGAPLARTDEEGRMAKLNRLFDTHPPIDDRIAALREI